MKTGELVDLLVRIEALERRELELGSRVRELERKNVQLQMTQRSGNSPPPSVFWDGSW